MALYIIKEGEIAVIKDGVQIAIMNVGSYFGENALLDKTTAQRSASIKTVSDEVVCLSLSRQLLLDVFGDDVSKLSMKNLQRQLFRQSNVLNNFNDF